KLYPSKCEPRPMANKISIVITTPVTIREPLLLPCSALAFQPSQSGETWMRGTYICNYRPPTTTPPSPIYNVRD
ncbi:hypothetical protein ACTXT7_006647, partial [Hymenolepis weldensis]